MTGDGARVAGAGALLAMLGIGLGAFAAHGLRAVLDETALGWWHNAVQYQMWNAIGLVALGALPRRLGLAPLLIVAAVMIFSGSLYAMALTGERRLGMITPIGGVLMIAGWGLAGFRLLRGAEPASP